MGYKLQVTSGRLMVVGCEWQVPGCELQAVRGKVVEFQGKEGGVVDLVVLSSSMPGVATLRWCTPAREGGVGVPNSHTQTQSRRWLGQVEGMSSAGRRNLRPREIEPRGLSHTDGSSAFQNKASL